MSRYVSRVLALITFSDRDVDVLPYVRTIKACLKNFHTSLKCTSMPPMAVGYDVINLFFRDTSKEKTIGAAFE